MLRLPITILYLVRSSTSAQQSEYTSWWTVWSTFTLSVQFDTQQIPTPALDPSTASAPVQVIASSHATSSVAAIPTESAGYDGFDTGKKGVIYPAGTEGRIAALSPDWGCNWANEPRILDAAFDFVPQLWGEGEDLVAQIDAAAAPYSSVLFYNEPDQCGNGGSCVDVSKAILDWTSYMLPLQKQGKKVSTPCVTNGQNLPGQYMDLFLKAFPKGSIDILCFHWYGTCVSGNTGCLQENVEAFQTLQKTFQIKELWLSEFGDRNSDLANIAGYVNYLNRAAVDRYAYNIANLPVGASL